MSTLDLTSTTTTTGGTVAAAAPCAPSPVTLTGTTVVPATLAGWESSTPGVAVDELNVYLPQSFHDPADAHHSSGPGALYVYDRATLAAGSWPEPQRIEAGWQPRSVASLVRPDYQRVFVVNYGQDSYSVMTFDRSTWELLHEAKTGMTPIDVAVHAGRGRAYVSSAYEGIRVIDAATGKELPGEKIAMEREVVGLAVHEASDTLVAARQRHYGAGAPVDDLLFVDLKTRTVTRTLKLPAGCGPRDVAIDATTVYVGTVNTADGKIGVYAVDRAAPTAPPRHIRTTAGVLAVALGRSGGTTYVYAAASGGIDVLDAARGERVGSLPLSRQTAAVAVDALTGDVYAGDTRDGGLHRLVPLVTGGPIGQHPQVAGGALGAPAGAPRPAPDGESVLQPFTLGSAVASADWGAVAVGAAHAAAWLAPAAGNARAAADPAASQVLGNPVGDTTVVNGTPVTYFENGMVASATVDGAPAEVIVSGAIWDRYRDQGDAGGGFGPSASHERVTASGKRSQRFERATIFTHDGVSARAVPAGPVDDAWRTSFGGPGGFLGFPVSDLQVVRNPTSGFPVAEVLELQNGMLVRSFATGEVHLLLPEIFRGWQAEGGATGRLGLPTSSASIGGPEGTPDSPVRWANFTHGALVWFPDTHRHAKEGGGCHVATSLELFVTHFRTEENDQGNPDNPPDMYVDLYLKARHGNEAPFLDLDQRFPGEDDWWQDTPQMDVDIRRHIADVVTGDLVVRMTLVGKDDDAPDGDDELGIIERQYDVTNLWGMLEETDEHHASTSDGNFWAFYRMKRTDADTYLGDDFRSKFFWSFDNPETPRLSMKTYGRTFRDVEPGFQFHIEPDEYVREGWEHAFYHLAYKGAAKTGNCFGMCAEAIHAFHHRSVLPQPIADVPLDANTLQQLNIRHGYQLGDAAVRWFAMHVLDGVIDSDASIHDGRRVWRESKAAFERGDWPVLCMVQTWDTSGHVVLPIAWHKPENEDEPWEIWIADPGKPPTAGTPLPNDAQKLLCNKDGSWYYTDNYSSGKPRWLFWAPYSTFHDQPRTPWKEAGGAILGGIQTLMTLGGDAETHQVSDASGRTLYRPGLTGAPSTPADLRRDGSQIPGVSRIPVFAAADGPADVELYLARGAHESLTHDVVPRAAGGRYLWATRTDATAAVIDAPTDGAPDRISTERLGSAGRAVSVSRAKTAPRKELSMMVEAMPRSRTPRQHRVRQFQLDSLAVHGGQRVTARVADGGGELLLSSAVPPGIPAATSTVVLRLRGEAGTPLSRPRTLTLEPNRTLRIRPSSWTPAGLDAKPVVVEVRERPDGPPIRCQEVLPDGPAES